MSKIIYISQEKLSDKVMRDWFIKDFSCKDNQIEFWDVTYLIAEKNNSNKAYKNVKLFEFRNIADFEDQIKKNNTKKAVYIIIIPFTYEALKVYKLISKYNLFTIFFAWGESPGIFTKRDIFSKVKAFFSLKQSNLKLIKRVAQRQYVKLHRAMNLINKYNITFFAGDICRENIYSEDSIGINLCDYQQYLSVDELFPYKKFSVFIDINAPYHEDYGLFKYKVDDTKYYNSLNNFFTEYERKYKTNVVIAAHPKSNYKKDRFDGRAIYQLKTAALIKSCNHVLMHHSTAISHAILSYKPIIFFITTDMTNSTDHLLTRGLALSLGSNIISIDESYANIPDKIALYKDLYDNYKYNYIVSIEAEGFNNIDIVNETIKKIIQK